MAAANNKGEMEEWHKARDETAPIEKILRYDEHLGAMALKGRVEAGNWCQKLKKLWAFEWTIIYPREWSPSTIKDIGNIFKKQPCSCTLHIRLVSERVM